MNAFVTRIAFVTLCCARHVGSVRAGMNMGSANPIRRVVSMLQMMQKQIMAEGEREEQLHEKFSCYCKTQGGGLQQSIEMAQSRVPKLESEIGVAKAEAEQLKNDITQHKKDRDDAKQAVVAATAQRTKEAEAFATDHAESVANIDAVKKALAALGSNDALLLQTALSQSLERAISNTDLQDDDREKLVSFLGQSSGQSGGDDYHDVDTAEIVGILQQMVATMTTSLKDVTDVEQTAKKDYASLMSARANEVKALTTAISRKSLRRGSVEVEKVNLAEDLDNTKESLAKNQEFRSQLQTNCKGKDDDWKARRATRSDELLAISETIKLLNDDESLELFKKTLPSTSFLEVQVSSKDVLQKARRALQAHSDTRIDLLSLAMGSKTVNFDRVTSMIDDMVTLLTQEQDGDKKKKQYCLAEFDAADDEHKALARDVSDWSKVVANFKGTLSVLEDDLAALMKDVQALDASVAEATADRKAEHTAFVDELLQNNAAREIIGLAENRMNKFYNGHLYKAEAKRELSEEERISVNMGGTLAPTAPPSGIAGTDVLSFFQGGDSAEQSGSYQKYSGSAGVIAMLDVLVKDLAKEANDMQVDEDHAQAEYQQFLKDGAQKRAIDQKAVNNKKHEHADLKAKLQAARSKQKSRQSEANANLEYIHSLHEQCDWLVANFQARLEARESEIDSLTNAKAILSGADYAL